MDEPKWCLRVGAAVIAGALLLRLSSDPPKPLLNQPNMISFLIYLETGRKVRFSLSETQPPTEAARPVSAPAEEITFTAEDGERINFKNDSHKDFDPGELIELPLNWDLTGETPGILILHTHATESYTKASGETYEESSDYRTLDTGHNLVSVGTRLTNLLEEGGLSVIHSKVLHDYPSYNGSYSAARRTMEEILAQNPAVRLVLDLHRDASGDPDNQMKTEAMVDGQPSAQLMFVVGTDGSGLNHPGWRENLSLAMKLQSLLEEKYPGLCRPINLRSQRFNQDKSPGALIVEVGAAGNTREEALTAVSALADAILQLQNGANLVK